MTSHVTQDIRLLYEAVYDQDLREKADEYNYQVRDEDIVEVATEYFYTYGLNSDGVDILIEKVGLDNFVEFVYDLSEDYVVLDEAKKKYVSHLAKSRQEAKQKAAEAAQERKDDEKKPESRGADTEAKEEQPKSKKPEKGGIRGAIERGMERHRLATTVASKVAQKAGPALGKGLMHGVGGTLGLIGKIASSGLKEEFEYWVNSLVEEGYDLSDYTWDDMYDIYLDEAAKRTPKKVRGAKPSDEEWQRGRSDAGKRVSGDEEMGPRKYSLGRRVALDAPTKPGERPQNTPRLADWEKDDIQYRKANLKAGKTHKVGGKKGLPESYDNFDIILEYLVAEGYADTNEDALAIMANMSEEWREDIIDEAVLGARRGTIRAVIEKGGRSIRYVPSGGDILAGDRAAAERASAAARVRSGKNRANAARAEQWRKKSIENLNAKPGEDEGDYDTGYYGDDDTSDGKRHYSLSHTNRDARRRRASGR